MLNDSIWFATGQAIGQAEPLPAPCNSQRFDLYIKTDIPYPGFPGKGFVQDSITGCIVDCRASQWLTFFNIPTKKGKYRIAKLDKCGMPFDYHYAWISYAGGLVMPFYPGDKKSGWVRVTDYNPETRLVEGRFKGTFADSTGRVARFELGAFQLVVQQRKNPVNKLLP